MSKTDKKTIFLYSSSILVGILLLFRYISLKEITIQTIYQETLWYCTFAAWVFLIGIIIKKKELINAILLSATGAQFLWIVDLILEILGFGLGRTSQILTFDTLTIIVITAGHILTIPVTFYYSYLFGYSKKTIYYTIIIFILGLLSITFFTTPYQENVNCMFFPCDWTLETEEQTLINSWFFLKIPYYVIQILFWMILSLPVHLIYCKIFSKLK